MNSERLIRELPRKLFTRETVYRFQKDRGPGSFCAWARVPTSVGLFRIEPRL